MARFIPVDRDTQRLFPPSVQEWLQEDHLARTLVDVVAQLDLSGIEQSDAGRGSDAHHPAILVALLRYGYVTGTFSSRALERASYDSIAFRYLTANTDPDHGTIKTSLISRKVALGSPTATGRGYDRARLPRRRPG